MPQHQATKLSDRRVGHEIIAQIVPQIRVSHVGIGIRAAILAAQYLQFLRDRHRGAIEVQCGALAKQFESDDLLIPPARLMNDMTQSQIDRPDSP